MSWLDQLQPASFRGVPFQVDSLEHSAGDNVVLREYPFQDLPTVFTMGEGAEEIKFSAYVIGDDYDEQREALRDVLSGDGVLIHPTAGSIRVFVAGKYTIKEAPTAEGGMARFDLTFVRAEPRRYPAGVANTGEDASDAGDDAETAATDDFTSSWDLDGQPSWVGDRAVDRVRSSIESVWAQVAGAAANLGDYTSALIGGYQALTANLDSLVSNPALLAAGVAGLFALPTDLDDAAARGFQAAFAAVFDLSTILSDTDFEVSVMPPIGEGLVMYGTGKADVLGLAAASRAQLDALTSTSDRLFETLATAAWVKATTAVDLSNYDDAMTMRQAVHAQATRLLTEASQAAPALVLPASSWHDAMLGLHTAALRDLQSRSRDLVRLTTFTPQGWMPVWYVSYLLFGTTDYADEILAMNPAIQHPLLVPPGQALRIVRHD